jgi:hypothetical protein
MSSYLPFISLHTGTTTLMTSRKARHLHATPASLIHLPFALLHGLLFNNHTAASSLHQQIPSTLPSPISRLTTYTSSSIMFGLFFTLIYLHPDSAQNLTRSYIRDQTLRVGARSLLCVTSLSLPLTYQLENTLLQHASFPSSTIAAYSRETSRGVSLSRQFALKLFPLRLFTPALDY